jgi:NAD(P)-dependent dehydrogenase (short-subunit alcohol dehydrogenase family)
MKRIALVTGANKGLGFETSRALAKNGIKVLLGSRNLERGEKAVEALKKEGLDVELLHIDVSNADSIKNAVTEIKSKYEKLDILVNNAGMIHKDEDWQANTTKEVSVTILKDTFETNFFGLVDLTQQLLPLIKKGENGNIVNVSSILGSLNAANDSGSDYYNVKPFAYNSSKAALNSFTIHLAAALKHEKIKVNSAHPGWVKTDLGTQYAPLTIEEGVKTIVDLALETSDETAKFIHLGEEIAW